MATISGTVKDSTGAFIARTVRAYRRSDGAFAGQTVSNATTGAYSVATLDTTPHYVIELDGEATAVTTIDLQDRTVLACHFNGTNGSTTFTDEKGHTMTPTGNAQLTTTSPKFGTACATFDGTGDYVTVADVAELEFAGAEFTIEFWMKTTQTTAFACPLSRDNTTFPAGAWAFLMNNPSSGHLQFWNASYSTGVAMLATTTAGLNDGNWHHIALVRYSGFVTLYKDGVQEATIAWTGTVTDAALDISIGRQQGYSRDYNGQMDDLRISKFARYTAAFTPPTAAFTDSADLYELWGKTVLHLPFDADFNDKKGHSVTTVGTPVISSTNGRAGFGNNSCQFNGSNYLTLSSSADFGFGVGDFTVEFWLYCTFNAAVMSVIDARPSDTATPWNIGITGTGLARSYDGATIRTGGQLTNTAWNHVAWTRDSGVNTVWVNGVAGHTWTASTDFQSSRSLTIGGNAAHNVEMVTGFVDDVLFLKGIARYKTTFTPPSIGFVGQSIPGTPVQNALILDNITPV